VEAVVVLAQLVAQQFMVMAHQQMVVQVLLRQLLVHPQLTLEAEVVVTVTSIKAHHQVVQVVEVLAETTTATELQELRTLAVVVVEAQVQLLVALLVDLVDLVLL
jgi:hypothetical protein